MEKKLKKSVGEKELRQNLLQIEKECNKEMDKYFDQYQVKVEKMAIKASKLSIKEVEKYEKTLEGKKLQVFRKELKNNRHYNEMKSNLAEMLKRNETKTNNKVIVNKKSSVTKIKTTKNGSK